MINGARIVHLVTVPDSLIFLRGHCVELSKRGAEVVAISSPGVALEQFGADEGVRTEAVRMWRAITPTKDLVAILRLVRIFRRYEADVVHAHTPKAGLLGMIAGWISRTPVRIYHIHGLPFETRRGLKGTLLRVSEWLACRLATGVLCVSSSCLKVAVDQGLCPAGKGQVLGDGSIGGVDLARFDRLRVAQQATALRSALAIEPEDPVVGFLGRVVKDKGIVDLWAAWQQIRQQSPKAHLVIAGKFEEEDPLPDDVVRALHRDERVHLIGFQSDPAVLLATLSVLAFPSHREGFGLAAIEAGALNVPVVATRVTGLVDAVQDGVTGTTVPPHDPDSLATAVLAYLEQPSLASQHGLAGHRRARRSFDPGRLRSEMRGYYEQALESIRS